MSAPLLRAEGLAKRFGALTAANDVSFSMDEGRLVALIGPNGAGKTTLINLISGSLRPDAGRILFDGADISALDMPARARLGLARSFRSRPCSSNTQRSKTSLWPFRRAPARASASS